MKMKILKRNGLENFNFGKLAINEHFIYVDGSFEFFAIKTNENYAVLINADGEFACARAYKNCLSLSTTGARVFPTFEKAVEFCERENQLDIEYMR